MDLRWGRSVRSATIAVAAVAAAAGVAACGSSGSGGPSDGSTGAGSAVAKTAASASLSCRNVKTGGSISVGVTQDVISFDAANTQDNGSLWADMNVYNQLIELTPTAKKLVPGLATSWKVENGGKTYIFHLRKAKFSDGSPVTAADVKFSWDRASSPKALANFALADLKSTKVINTYTLQANLKAVSSSFLNDVALWPASVLDEAAFKQEGEAKFKDHPVGSGPFSVKSFQPGNEVVLKKNPYYWQKDSCGNTYPYLNQVALKYIPNDNTRVTALQGGQLDAMFNVPYNQVSSLNSGDITSAVTPQLGIAGLALSQKVPAFRNTKVLQAINYAVDREAIVKSVFFGNAKPAESAIAPGIDDYDGAYGYTYDLPKAKKLMAASGVKSFTATLTVPSGDSQASAIAQIFQSEIKQIGGTIKIQSLDSTTLDNEEEEQKLQISYGAGTYDNLDPSANAQFCCVSNGGAHSNYTGWKDPKADALFDQTQVTLNAAKRQQLYAQWQKEVMAKGPFVWLVNPTNTFAYHKDIHDLFLQPTAHYPLWVAWKS
jgi:peptide/nickel transport system substrate-binding protein